MNPKKMQRPNKSLLAPNKALPDPSKPLRDAKRELFAQRVALGTPVKAAYEQSGYVGGRFAMHDVRRAPAVAARIDWLLEQRVMADTRRRHESEKVVDDLRIRTLKELERLAFADVRAVVQWTRRPQISEDGDVLPMADELVVTPSHLLTQEQAASVKNVFLKAGGVRVEMHDKLAALRDLCKALGLGQEAPPPPQSVVVNQLNIESNALEAARRVAFLLAAMAHKDNQKSIAREEPTLGVEE